MVIVTKYCSIVLKVLSFVLCGSTVQYDSTKVLFHYVYGLGFRGYGLWLGFGVWGSEFEVWDAGLLV